MASQVIKQRLFGFSGGFTYPFSSFRFIRSHPVLYKFIIMPLLINLSVFSSVIYYGFNFFQNAILARIPQGDAWYWFLLNYFLVALGILLTLVLVFFSFAVVGSLIASPFNDILSERTELLLRGEISEEPFSWALFIKDAARTLTTESKKISLFILGMLLLLLLNLIPGIGSMLYSVLSFLWTVFFLIVEYNGYVFSRKRLTFAEQRRVILDRFSMMFGFGVGVFCILAIPFLQFLSIPLGVVGATRMIYDAKLIEEL